MVSRDRLFCVSVSVLAIMQVGWRDPTAGSEGLQAGGGEARRARKGG